jgi:hypothetical protein
MFKIQSAEEINLLQKRMNIIFVEMPYMGVSTDISNQNTVLGSILFAPTTQTIHNPPLSLFGKGHGL